MTERETLMLHRLAPVFEAHAVPPEDRRLVYRVLDALMEEDCSHATAVECVRYGVLAGDVYEDVLASWGRVPPARPRGGQPGLVGQERGVTKRLFPIMVSSHRVADEVRALRVAGASVMVIAVPWDLIAPHAAQARSNHGQTLERLAERGGLGPCEAVAVLEGRP